MGYARKSLLCVAETPYYHVIARCVRRAWLWGRDDYAGKDYSHRKAWVIQQLQLLSGVFTIDLCAYAIMSNHYHLVLRIDRERARRLSRAQVVARWSRLFGVPPAVARWRDGHAGQAERELAEQLIERWRARLWDLSWFMRCLNEPLARRANAEEGCTGRFWEGRFKSQALLDEAALLTAMTYVDLNPVRAGLASVPEDCPFTSIHARLQRLRRRTAPRGPALLAFRDPGSSAPGLIPWTLPAYLQLVDWSGRRLRPDRPGAIDPRAPPILSRLGIDPQAWPLTLRPAGYAFGRALGRLQRLRSLARALGQSWVKGLRHAERLYRTA